MEGLPEELTMLILVKLPVKSLVRSKCVRKSWYSLINSPQFIRLHRSSSSPQFVIYRWAWAWVIEEFHHLLSFYSYETLEDLGNTFTMPITHPEMGSLIDLCACDGLICITNHTVQESLQIFICNPAIREFRSLFMPPSFLHISGYQVDSVGFAADPKTGEYKVVMIGAPYDNSHYYDPDIPDEDCLTFSPDHLNDDRDAKVYDFSTDSWRDTAVVIPAPFCYKFRPVSLNGSFHWSPYNFQNYFPFPWDATILTFHIGDEVTESITLPDFVGAEQFATMELFVSGKSQLSLVVGCDDVGSGFEIIVMTEYGVKESWTRLFQIGPMMNIDAHIAFWDEQHILLIHHVRPGERQLVSYDRHQNHLRHFPISHVHIVCSYSESLVSVNALR